MARPKPAVKRHKAPAQTTWAGAWKSIGIKAVERGQLIHFGLLSVFGIIAYRIESKDLVEIAHLAFGSGFITLIGWVLFLGTAAGSGVLLKAQRTLYAREIERLSTERTRLQGHANNQIQSSGWEGGS